MASAYPDKLKIVAWRGATFRLTVTLYEEDDEDTVRDLTDYTGELQVLERKGSPDVLLTLDSENGGIEIDGEQGEVNLYVSADEIREQEWNQGVYDLTITAPEEQGGDTEALLYGAFVIKGVD